MKPRVLHVIPFLWSGAGRVVSQLCLSQTSRYDVAIVTSASAGGQADWPVYRKALRAGGVAHHRINFFHRDPATLWTGVQKLDALIAEWRPDVVHTHAGVPACAAAAVTDATDVGFRHVNHVYNWGAGRPAWMNTMDLSGIRAADAVICSATAYRDLLLRSGVASRRLAYIPWGLDLPSIGAPGEPPPARAPRLGFVGRIEPRKGQLELVRGFARYHRTCPEATLELVGPVADPAYATRIAHAVRTRGLQRAVTLTGRVRDVYRHVRGWNLFVSLSADEGQGLAALEAMALGVPVLGLAVAGVEDYLRDGVTGWVAPSARADDVATAIGRAVAPSQRGRVTVRARRMVERRYAWDRSVQAIDRVYDV